MKRICRKYIHVLLGLALVLLASCTKSDPAKTAASAFLDALKNGDYEAVLNSTDSSLYKSFEETYSADHLLENYYDEDLRQSFADFRARAISAQCLEYKITETKEDGDSVIYTVEVIQVNTGEAENALTLDAYAAEHTEEFARMEELPEEEAEPVRMKLVLDYSTAVLDEAVSKDLTDTVNGTVTVTKSSDNTWTVTGYRFGE